MFIQIENKENEKSTKTKFSESQIANFNSEVKYLRGCFSRINNELRKCLNEAKYIESILSSNSSMIIFVI